MEKKLTYLMFPVSGKVFVKHFLTPKNQTLLKYLLVASALFLIFLPAGLAYNGPALPAGDGAPPPNDPCRQSDSLALVALYNATDGANWTNTWDLSQPMDTWLGVTLSAGGCVEELNLQYRGLNGTLPPELGNLSQLGSLFLNANQLDGPVPATLANLGNLTRLYCQDNQMSGCFPDALAVFCALGFSTNPNIEGYNFSNNPDLSGGGDFQAFCDTGAGACATPPSCPDLQVLKLSYDNGVMHAEITNVGTVQADCGIRKLNLLKT